MKRDCVHGVRGERNNSRAMTASVQRFQFQYPDRSIKKDHPCNEAKTKKSTWPEEEPRGRKRRRDQKTNEWRMNGRRPRGNQGKCFIVIRAMWDETERRLTDGGRGKGR